MSRSSAIEVVAVPRACNAALVQPIELLLLAPEILRRHCARRRIILSFLGGGLLAHSHIKLHAAIRHRWFAWTEAVASAFPLQRIVVCGSALVLFLRALLLRRTPSEHEQDCEISLHIGLHIREPFFSHKASANVRKELLRQAASA